MEEYDNMAQMYIQQMTERHAIVLMEFQKQLRTELASKPPKWSRELMDQRRQQHINARNKNYTTAQKLKKISDKNEEKERKEMEQEQAIIFARREAKYRQQQQTELSALLKRIECRRKEHIKQRNLDTKRLLQRNKNVQAVLEQKQNAEAQKLFADIKKFLYGTAILHGGQAPSSKTGTNYNISNSYGNNNTNNSYNNSKQFSDNQARDEYKMHEDSPSNDNDIRNNSNSNNSNSYYEDETHKQDGKDNSRDDNASYPQFLQQPGPNFNEMVYNSQDSFGEDED